MTDGLLLDRKELKEALTRIRKTSKARGRAYAYLYFGTGQLKIQIGSNMRVSVLAKGAWPHPIAVNAVMLGRVSLDLPKDDPILLQDVQGRLYIGSLSLDSKKVDSVPDFLESVPAVKPSPTPPKPTQSPAKTRDGLSLPPNASSKHILQAALERTPQELALAGLSGRVEKALMERNRRITKALDQLSLYGVNHTDLVTLVEARLKTRA